MGFQVIMANAANYTKNRAAYGGRAKKITVHHMAGNLSVERLGALWQNPARRGSSHYGIQGDNIAQYVREEDIAWTDSNWESNKNSITIETANSGGAPNWPVADNTLATLIRLCADIAARNGLGNLVPGLNLTWHQMYAATACPGPYLLGKMQYIANEANKINSASEAAPSPSPAPAAPSHGINVGDRVTVNQGAKFINTSTPNPIPAVYQTTYDVLKVKGNDIQIGLGSAVTGWMDAASLSKVGTAPAPAPAAIGVGSTVRINQGATDYNGTPMMAFVYGRNNQVSELNGDRAVVTYSGVVVGAFRVSDLTLV